jgi:hypothetical protein
MKGGKFDQLNECQLHKKVSVPCSWLARNSFLEKAEYINPHLISLSLIIYLLPDST